MKKKPNWFLRIVFILFLFFMAMYISSVSGYQERKRHEKVLLTEDAIKEFENDILAGKEVDVKTYIDNDTKDYSNFLTKTGDNITGTIEAFLTDGLSGVWDAVKVLFW